MTGPHPLPRLAQLVASADALWEEAAARAGKDALACRSGCFGCCVGLFTITLPEALVVREAVSRLAPDVRVGVLERAARAVHRSAGLFPGDANAGLLDPERSEEADARYFEETSLVACPLLSLPDGRCLAYGARPITCRTYGLAWREAPASGAPAQAPCTLNLVGATEERQLESAIEGRRVLALDQELAAAAVEAGLPGGAETTVAHALVGTFLDTLEPRDP